MANDCHVPILNDNVSSSTSFHQNRSRWDEYRSKYDYDCKFFRYDQENDLVHCKCCKASFWKGSNNSLKILNRHKRNHHRNTPPPSNNTPNVNKPPTSNQISSDQKEWITLSKQSQSNKWSSLVFNDNLYSLKTITEWMNNIKHNDNIIDLDFDKIEDDLHQLIQQYQDKKISNSSINHNHLFGRYESIIHFILDNKTFLFEIGTSPNFENKEKKLKRIIDVNGEKRLILMMKQSIYILILLSSIHQILSLHQASKLVTRGCLDIYSVLSQTVRSNQFMYDDIKQLYDNLWLVIAYNVDDYSWLSRWMKKIKETTHDYKKFLPSVTLDDNPYSLKCIIEWVKNTENNDKIIKLDFDKIEEDLQQLIEKYGKKMVSLLFYPVIFDDNLNDSLYNLKIKLKYEQAFGECASIIHFILTEYSPLFYSFHRNFKWLRHLIDINGTEMVELNVRQSIRILELIVVKYQIIDTEFEIGSGVYLIDVILGTLENILRNIIRWNNKYIYDKAKELYLDFRIIDMMKKSCHGYKFKLRDCLLYKWIKNNPDKVYNMVKAYKNDNCTLKMYNDDIHGKLINIDFYEDIVKLMDHNRCLMSELLHNAVIDGYFQLILDGLIALEIKDRLIFQTDIKEIIYAYY